MVSPGLSSGPGPDEGRDGGGGVVGTRESGVLDVLAGSGGAGSVCGAESSLASVMAPDALGTLLGIPLGMTGGGGGESDGGRSGVRADPNGPGICDIPSRKPSTIPSRKDEGNGGGKSLLRRGSP